MTQIKIPYSETGYFSKLICDYINQNPALSPFYQAPPAAESLMHQIKLKQAVFSQEQRTVLSSRLEKQYHQSAVSEATQKNIDALKNPNTFTITTGHQLNLFTGPVYFLYKIASVVNLCKTLAKKYPSYNFVPVYWMATEDHDFEEINHFFFKGKKIAWQKDAKGPVGEIDTQGLGTVFSEFAKVLGDSVSEKYIKELFSNTYLKHTNLADATRFLVNELFAKEGLVIIDGNDAELKKQFVPVAKNEIENQLSYKIITHTTSQLVAAGYHEQVHPRELNLFYCKPGIRERIVAKPGGFSVLNTSLFFTKETLLSALQENPAYFSPNALLRPVYQEIVLPNLGYVGGGGELAYWFQLKDYFKKISVPFPILLLRNSVLFVSEKISKKLKKLDVPVEKLFLSPEALTAWFTKKNSELKIDFLPQKELLKNQFKALYVVASKTDKSFLGAVAAQEKKQLKGLETLEKRLLKAEKKQLKDKIDRLLALREALFPNRNLQERVCNFGELYVAFGDLFFTNLKELDPLALHFLILQEENKT
jgi:bacillithiol biosynthesis cysteine-adding enzyme BshC